jgi:hypothetical protein
MECAIGMERSAFSHPMHRTKMGEMPSTLSSRPKRTRISCNAALDATACAPFCKGKAHELHQRHQAPQEIRGSGAEGSAVRPSAFPNFPYPIQALYPRLASVSACSVTSSVRSFFSRPWTSLLNASTLLDQFMEQNFGPHIEQKAASL